MAYLFQPGTHIHFVGVMLVLSLAAGCATSSRSTLSDAALSGDPDAMWTEGQDLALNSERTRRGDELLPIINKLGSTSEQ